MSQGEHTQYVQADWVGILLPEPWKNWHIHSQSQAVTAEYEIKTVALNWRIMTLILTFK